MSDEFCTVLIHTDKSSLPNVQTLKRTLEKGNDYEKIDAMESVLTLILNGTQVPQLLVPIIRYVMPAKNHRLKKLGHLYLEVVEKNKEDPTLILVCNALMRDLNYPNEYVRGSVLRLLCKLKVDDLLIPLLPYIQENLDHRHAYVRRNAVLAIFSIYQDFPQLIQDAPQIIFDYLGNEDDDSCKRNAFLMLFSCAREKAIEFLNTQLEDVMNMGDTLQMVVVQMIRKLVRSHPEQRGRYIKTIYSLLSSTSSAVQFEAATTLVSLSGAPTAVKAAAGSYIHLLVNASDNNVKLVVLDKLLELKKEHKKVLQALVMDVLVALQNPAIDIREKALNLALDLVTVHNIKEVVELLKKEILKSQSETFEDGSVYRRKLVKGIHQCALKFPNVAGEVVHVLLDFLGDDSDSSGKTGSAVEVVSFAREVVQTYPTLRSSVLTKLLESFDQIHSSRVYRAALWIIGEYAESSQELRIALATVKKMTGTAQIQSQATSAASVADPEASSPSTRAAPASTGPRVLADGTYATASALSEASIATTAATSTASSGELEIVSTLHKHLLSPDPFLGAVLAVTLTKLALKIASLPSLSGPPQHRVRATVLLYLTSLLRLATGEDGKPIDRDSYERIVVCLKLLTQTDLGDNEVMLTDTYTHLSRQSFSVYLAQQQAVIRGLMKNEEENSLSQNVDDLPIIRQLLGRNRQQADLDLEEEEMDQATGASELTGSLQELTKVVQLTGFSDPVYAEAFVDVHQYDITLNVTVINQTPDTLRQLSLELATLGDLKLVERPTSHSLGPYAKMTIVAHIKVSSTENGAIFGSLVYETSAAGGRENVVVLNEIKVDIIEYIEPAYTDETKFRQMWQAFEWENKLTVHTNQRNLRDFLKLIVTSTKMNCLTPATALEGECGFLAANLYARSIFGEDALANICIEQVDPASPITGHIRIRSKTQGIAISLGEKIQQEQKG